MRAFKQLPDVADLRREFDYAPESGLLFRKTQKGLIVAGNVNKNDGYLQVGFGGPGKMWSGHRLIWKLVTSDDPGALQVDHINRIRHDNRWCNLRLVDMSTQMANRGVLATSSTGIKGVYKNCKPNTSLPFKSSIMRNGRHVHLGCFATADEAQAAYLAAGGLP